MSILVSLVAGWILLIGVTFAIQHYTAEVGAAVPPAQIFIDAIGGTGGKLLLLIVIIAQLFCGMSSVTANSRMIYAFSRDGALPGSAIWHKVNSRDADAHQRDLAGGRRRADPRAAVPVEQHRVRRGHLDRGHRPVRRLRAAHVPAAAARVRVRARAMAPGPVVARRSGSSSVAWVVIITILFMLPTVYPITWKSFNYTVIAVVAVLGFAGVWWLVSARNWFTGPKVQGTAEELAAIEAELS